MTRDASDLVLGDDRAAREAPDAAVDHAHAEAGRAAVADCRLAASASRQTAAAASAAAAARRRRRRPPPPPKPPRSSKSRLPPFAFTPLFVARVKRMSAHVQPSLFGLRRARCQQSP